MKSAPAIAFDFRPCRATAVAVGALTALALLAIGLSGLETRGKWVLAVLALVGGVRAIHQHLRARVVRIACNESGWLLLDAEAQEHAVTLTNHVRRGVFLSLEFRDESSRSWRLLLTPANSDGEQRRRIWLMLAAVPKPRTIGDQGEP